VRYNISSLEVIGLHWWNSKFSHSLVCFCSTFLVCLTSFLFFSIIFPFHWLLFNFLENNYFFPVESFVCDSHRLSRLPLGLVRKSSRYSWHSITSVSSGRDSLWSLKDCWFGYLCDVFHTWWYKTSLSSWTGITGPWHSHQESQRKILAGNNL